MTENEVVEQNIGLARQAAYRFSYDDETYEEFYSTALFGLLKAIRNFDNSVQFSTFAYRVIDNECKRKLYLDGMKKRKLNNPYNRLSLDYKMSYSSCDSDGKHGEVTYGDFIPDNTDVEEEVVESISDKGIIDNFKTFIETSDISQRHKAIASRWIESNKNYSEIAREFDMLPGSVTHSIKRTINLFIKSMKGKGYGHRQVQ